MMDVLHRKTTVELAGKKIPVTGQKDLVKLALTLSSFRDWLARVANNGIDYRSIEIRDAINFGPINFVVMNLQAFDRTGKRLPGYVFLRGSSTATLVLLRCGTERYVLLTRQARAAFGPDVLEICAGSGSHANGVLALKEIKEELDLEVSGEQLTHLTPDMSNVSPGGTDETMDLYGVELAVTQEQLQQLNGRFTGLAIENEHIVTVVMPLEQACKEVRDIKFQAALGLWNILRPAV